MATTPLVLSAAKNSSSQGLGYRVGPVSTVNILASVTAASGTTPNLVLSLEWSHNNSLWFKGDPADQFTAITTTGTAAKNFTPKGTWFRLVWTITGTTPSFTFSVDAHWEPL